MARTGIKNPPFTKPKKCQCYALKGNCVGPLYDLYENIDITLATISQNNIIDMGK